MTDAYGALSYLSSLPFVDEERVLLMGFSHGGSATIHALQPTSWLPPDSPRFMAGVAMYPYCSANMRRLYAPLTIIIGEKDDWTPAVLCVGSASGTDVPVHVIPNTHHGFDSFPWKGEPEGPVVNQWGKTWSPSHTATERARQLVDSFLKTCCTEDTPRQHRQAPVETVTLRRHQKE